MTKLMKRTMKLTAISMVLVLALSSCALAAPRDGQKPGGQPQMTRTMGSRADTHRQMSRQPEQRHEPAKAMHHEPVRHKSGHDSSSTQTAIAAGVIGLVLGAVISSSSCN